MSVRRPIVLLGLLCLALLAGAFLAPRLLPHSDPSDVVARQTARVAVLYWGLAVGALLLRRREFARAAWTWGCVAFLVHVVTALDRVHGWSHSAAVQHVHDVSGFGPGLFVSYFFTLLWTVDAAWWQLAPCSYDRRPAWLDRSIHLFMAFIVFNGTVVYETGLIRWAGIGLFLVLGVLLVRRKG
jgi:hypothetical protein